MTLHRLIFGLRLLPALGALILILIPGEVWSRPATDLSAEGIDPQAIYVDPSGDRYLFDPFQVLTNGVWRPCPCEPGTQLSLVGGGLSPVTLTSPNGEPQLGPVSLTVDGKRTRLYQVSPGQINFFLRSDATPPSASLQLFHDGQEVARQTIAIGAGSPAQPAGEQPEVLATHEGLRLHAPAGTTPAVHLVTSPLSFRASFAVAVAGGADGRPFQAMFWNPRNYASASVLFGPAPERRIEAVLSEARGRIIARRDLGAYDEGEPYRVEIGWQRGEVAELSVVEAGSIAEARSASFTAAEAPALFEAFRPSLTVLSRASSNGNDVSITDYRLDLPSERMHTVRANDAKILPLALALLAASGALHATALISAVLRAARRLRKAKMRTGLLQLLRRWWWAAPIACAAGAAAGYVMTLGSHPFDMASQKAWTYLLMRHGAGDLYYRAQTFTLAAVWDGIPFHEAVFPYGVNMSYFFYGVGWLHRAFGGDVAPDSAGLEVTIKAANALVAVFDAALVWALVRGMGRGRRLAWVIALAFVANPAFLFDILIWGETEPVALFPLLASLLAAQRGSPAWAWSLLAMAALGKPTMALPVFLTAVYYLRVFRPLDTVRGLSVALPLVLVAILPFLAAGYPPSIAVDPIFGAFRVFGGDAIEPVFQVVSFDGYNVWPLVTLWQHDAHGLARLHFSDQAALGPLSYHEAGGLAFFAIAATAAVTLLTSRRARTEPGFIFVVLALATLAGLVLPTRSVARYFLFPAVFALVAAGDGRSRSGWFGAAALTVTSFVGMFGSVASGLDSRAFADATLAPSNSRISSLMLDVFGSDVMITTGAALNFGALMLLAAMAWLPEKLRLRWGHITLPRWLPAQRQVVPAQQVER